LVKFHKNFGRSFVVLHVCFVYLVFGDAPDTIPTHETEFTLRGQYMHCLLSKLVFFEFCLAAHLVVSLQVLTQSHFRILLLLFDPPWSQWNPVLPSLLGEALDHIRNFGGYV